MTAPLLETPVAICRDVDGLPYNVELHKLIDDVCAGRHPDLDDIVALFQRLMQHVPGLDDALLVGSADRSSPATVMDRMKYSCAAFLGMVDACTQLGAFSVYRMTDEDRQHYKGLSFKPDYLAKIGPETEFTPIPVRFIEDAPMAAFLSFIDDVVSANYKAMEDRMAPVSTMKH